MTSEVNTYALDGKEMKEPSKSWERPWTTDEIRKNSDKWTLAGDVGLLKHLQDFSHHLISRTHEMEKVVDGLVHQSKDTSAKVNNVINDFQMLSNLKFVENRVYDEEIVDGTKKLNLEDQPKSKEQREAEMLARVKQALDLGLSVLDSAFEKIEDIESSDSEGEDMSQGRTRLEPKDYYEHRPLPFVIGSDEFQNDEYAGLRYLVDEEPVYELSAQDDNVSSISEDTDSNISDVDDDFEFVEEKPPMVDTPVGRPIVTEPPKKQIPNENFNNKHSDSEGSDLFGDEEENGYASAVSIDESPKETKSKDAFLKELGSKMNPTAAVPAANDEKPREKPRSNSIPKKSEIVDQKDESDDLFASEDSFLTDDKSPFGKSNGLFTSNLKFDSPNNNMFDDQGLFGKTEEKPIVKKEIKVDTKVHSNSVLLGDDDDDQDLFGSFSSSTISAEPKKSISKVNSSQSFESSNKTAISSPAGSTKGSIRSISSKAKSEDSLFGPDSDNDNLFSDTKTTQSKMSFDFGNSNDDDLFNTLDTKEKKSSKLEAKEISEIKSDVKSNLLFDNSDDFDLFNPKETVKKPVPKIEKTIQEKVPNKTVQKEHTSSIFDESSSIDLFSPAKTAKDVEFMPNDMSILESIKIEETSPEKEASTIVPQKFNAASDNKYPLQLENQMTPITDLSSVENKEISFEKPVDSTNMLSDLKKDRAKIQVKRRKPTRKGRQVVQNAEKKQSKTIEREPKINHSTKQITNSNDLFSSVDISIHKSTEPIKIIPAAPHKKKEQQKKDLMSQLISEAANSRIGRGNAMHDDDDDLFSSVSTKDKLKLGSDEPKLGSDFSFLSPSSLKSSDFFDKPESAPDNLMTKGDDLFDKPKNIPDKLTTGSDDFLASNSLLDDDDDLFSSATFDDNLSNEKSPFSPGDNDDIFKIDKNEDMMFQDSDDIFADSTDDIFGNMEKKKYSMFPTTQNDDDDDDDIFNNLDKPAAVVAKEKPKNQVKEGKKQNDIFDDPLGLLS